MKIHEDLNPFRERNRTTICDGGIVARGRANFVLSQIGYHTPYTTDKCMNRVEGLKTDGP